MSLGLFTRKAKLAIAAATTVVLLAGCAAGAIYQLSQPIGECDGSEVSIALGEGQDTPEVNFEGGDIVDLTFTGNLADVEVEYRIGLYGDNGLETVNPEVMGPTSTESPSPTPDPVPTGTSEAFLDMFRYVTEEGPHFDLTGIFATSSDVSRDVARSLDTHRVSGSVLEFFASSESEVFDFINNAGSGLDEEVYTALISFPGAVLVKCITTGEYVAALPIFPNLIVLDEIALNLTETESVFRFPEELNGHSFQMTGLLRSQQEPLSENPKTDRWLQLLSSAGDVEAFDISGVIGVDGSITNVYEYWYSLEDGQYVSQSRPQFGVAYSVLLVALDESSTEFVVRSAKTATFDMNFSSSGQSQYTPFSGEYIPLELPPTENGNSYFNTEIMDRRNLAVVSSKGLRALELEVTNPTLVTSAKVGAKPAKGVRVSASGNLVIDLPKLPAGVYDLTLSWGDRQVTKPNFVKIKSSQQLASFEVRPGANQQSWSKQFRSVLGESSNTGHVACIAMVPKGANAAALESKARQICSSVGDGETSTRVVVKELPASGVPRVVVNLWR